MTSERLRIIPNIPPKILISRKYRKFSFFGYCLYQAWKMFHYRNISILPEHFSHYRNNISHYRSILEDKTLLPQHSRYLKLI